VIAVPKAAQSPNVLALHTMWWMPKHLPHESTQTGFHKTQHNCKLRQTHHGMCLKLAGVAIVRDAGPQGTMHHYNHTQLTTYNQSLYTSMSIRMCKLVCMVAPSLAPPISDTQSSQQTLAAAKYHTSMPVTQPCISLNQLSAPSVTGCAQQA
jgi:hypothetical protein